MKKILCIVLCIVMVLSLSACGLLGNKSDNKNPTVNNTQNENPTEDVNRPTDEKPTEPTDNKSEYREGSVEYVAEKFIDSLIKADYETALRNFAVPAETPYFTTTDIEWYLPRSNYAEVADVTYEKYTVTVEANKHDSETATCVVTVKDTNSEKSKTFNLNMIMDKSNKWGVKDNDFYLNEYYVVAPGGKAILTVDGVDASGDYVEKFGTAKYRSLYKLTYVGKSEKTFAVSSDNFETYEEKIYPVANTNSEPAMIVVKYDDQAALDYLKTTWGEVYQAVLDKKSYSDMVYILSPQADPALAQIIMTGVDLMRNNGVNYDFKVVDMSFCTDEAWITHWLSDTKLSVCFNYSLNWIDDPSYAKPKNCSMNQYDNIVLHFDGEKFTIDSLSKNNTFFTEVDAYDNKVK